MEDGAVPPDNNVCEQADRQKVMAVRWFS
ncbi:hypothetical protein ACK85N_004820 [Salmonella enterica]